ncbi:uncharacterized protein [Antedon mediterranea]|uniref:uncharacterized protein n=1 Tax=Antedon mediterranea TaxID=105859 RepID=UPI003AF77978
MVYQGELFTIENSVSFEKSGASKIILKIQKLVQMMILTFPIKWLQVLLEIQQLRKAKLYLPTSEINDLLARCKITDRKLFLEYLHDIGEILFYPDDKILKEKIVIDLMGVVDKFKTIITVIDPSIQPSLKQLWRNLNGGKLDERLLQHIWKDDSDEMIIFFVSLMQTFGLMCEKRSKEKVGRMFYVLSRLKPQRDDTKAAEYEEKHAISLFHDFDGYLPDDLFQRVATKFIEEFQMEDVEPTLSYEHVELNVDGHHLVLLNVATINNRRLFQTTIVRTTIMNTESGSSSPEDDDPHPSICKKVLSFLQKELHFLSEKNAHGVKVKMYIPCVCASKGEPTHMHVVRKFDKDVLPCGSRGMEVKRYRNLFGDNVLSKEESIEDKYVNNIGKYDFHRFRLISCFELWFLLVFDGIGSCLSTVPPRPSYPPRYITYSREELIQLRPALPGVQRRSRPSATDTDTLGAQIKNRKRGRRGGLKARLKRRKFSAPLPSILTGNAQSLRNKLDELKACTLDTESPDAVKLVTGDFNSCDLKKVSNYYQYVDFPTRGDKILDCCYGNIKNAYKSSPKAGLGKSDHKMIHLIPAY